MYQHLDGAYFEFDDEAYYVIKRTLDRKGEIYIAWCFYMFDEALGDLQYIGNLSNGLFFLSQAVDHFRKHKGEPPEWAEKK